MTYLSPSREYTIGVTRVSPDFAPLVVSIRTSRPTNGPDVGLPLLARMSSTRLRLKSPNELMNSCNRGAWREIPALGRLARPEGVIAASSVSFRWRCRYGCSDADRRRRNRAVDPRDGCRHRACDQGPAAATGAAAGASAKSIRTGIGAHLCAIPVRASDGRRRGGRTLAFAAERSRTPARSSAPSARDAASPSRLGRCREWAPAGQDRGSAPCAVAVPEGHRTDDRTQAARGGYRQSPGSRVT